MEHMRRWKIAERIRECSRVPPSSRRTTLVFYAALHGHELGVFRATASGLRTTPASLPPSRECRCRRSTRPACSRPRPSSSAASCSRARVHRTCTEERRLRCSSTRARTAITARVGSSAPAAGAAPCARPQAITDGGSRRRTTTTPFHAVISCPGLLEDLAVSAGCFYVLFNPQVGGLVLPSDVDEFNLHLAGYEPDAQVTVEELAAKARIVIGRDADVEVRRSSPYLIHELTAQSYRRGRVLIAGTPPATCSACSAASAHEHRDRRRREPRLEARRRARRLGRGRPARLLRGRAPADRPRELPGGIRQRRSARRRDRLGDRRRRAHRRDAREEDAERRRLGSSLYDATFPEWNTARDRLDSALRAPPR